MSEHDAVNLLDAVGFQDERDGVDRSRRAAVHSISDTGARLLSALTKACSSGDGSAVQSMLQRIVDFRVNARQLSTVASADTHDGVQAREGRVSGCVCERDLCTCRDICVCGCAYEDHCVSVSAWG